MNIKSSTNLRNNYNSVSKLAHETEEPIYITKNGEGDLVLMSIKAFERKMELLKLREKLIKLEEQRFKKESKSYSLEDAKKILKEKTEDVI